MCGITGILNLDNKPVDLPVIERMTDIIAHRGPDGEGFWNEGNIGFGHRRLAILDLSAHGHQPMMSFDKRYVLIYNGEIYNFRELRIELEQYGYKFHSQTDTEVLLNAWHKWHTKAIDKLNGMFAFALWDRKEHELFLVRDRYGIKPLYYWYHENKIVFASEIKSILQVPGYSVDVNISALNQYFSFQNIFTDTTLFKDIKLLSAGNYICIKANKEIKQTQYWDFEFKEEETYSSEAEYAEELDRLFRQAVNRQLVSDVEVGSFLSGGMDSGGITCIAAQNFKDLKTFTAGFDLSSASGLELAFDERPKAEFLSNLYKTEHYEIVLKAGDMERIMPKLIWHQEDLRVGQSYPNFYINRLASKFVKVILAGTGGDELFAGYPWRYYRNAGAENFAVYSKQYYNYWQRLISDEQKQNFFQPSIFQAQFLNESSEVFSHILDKSHIKNKTISPENLVNNSLYFEIKTFLQGLLLVEDKFSMANGLEMRVPFLDNDLVDFALKIPVKYKLRDLQNIVKINENDTRGKRDLYYEKTNDGKMLLRKVLENYVPSDYTKGIKQGFSAPDASWFKGESIEYVKKILLNKRAYIYDYLQPKAVENLLNLHFKGKENKRLLIWSLLSFEWWLKIFKYGEKN